MQAVQARGANGADMDIEWRRDKEPVPYEAALTFMDERAAAIRAGRSPETVWLLEHPPLYTAGTSTRDDETMPVAHVPFYRSGRGGQVTYHGPGQRVAYVLLDLSRRGADVRAHVCALENWGIAALAHFGVAGTRRPSRVGIWVPRPDKGAGHEAKIAAIGERVRRWVSMHGVAINIHPDLAAYRAIVPCGITDPRYGITSAADLGLSIGLTEFDEALEVSFGSAFKRVPGVQESCDTDRNQAQDNRERW